MVVKHVKDDTEYAHLFAASTGKVLIVDFFATWCGPCRNIAPVFEQLSNQYPQCIFLKVDVDKCQGTARNENISAMPTFIFFNNKVKVDMLKGANPQELAAKVEKCAAQAAAAGDTASALSPVPGQIDLIGKDTFSHLDRSRCECLNEDNSFSLKRMLDGHCPLKSDADEQLIINLHFSQPVKLHSLRIKGPENAGPKTCRLFINNPTTIDFDRAERSEPTQELELTKKQVSQGDVIELRYVRFQNVQNVQIFIIDNQEGEDVTVVDDIRVFGTPVQTTNMGDFKRVSGKAGEGHE